MNNNRLASIALALSGLLVPASCTRGPLGPTKEIEVPAGGAPVLTTAERAAKNSPGVSELSVGVVRASYDQPLDEPQPLKPFEQWTEQETAADALGRIGAAAVPSLLQVLQSADPAARLKAVEVLGRMGPTAADAVPQLIPLLDDADPAMRKAAARTLGRIGPAAQPAVPALLRSLLQPAPKPAS